MSYDAKTDWKYNDPVTEDDFNRIEQGIKDAHDLIDEESNDLTAHKNNNTRHITSSERDNWNNKVSQNDFDDAISDIDSQLTQKANQTDLDAISTNVSTATTLWQGTLESGAINLLEDASEFAILGIETSNDALDADRRGRMLVTYAWGVWGGSYYVPVQFGVDNGYMRITIINNQLTLHERNPSQIRIIRVIGVSNIRGWLNDN